MFRYKLTELGIKKCEHFIKECKAKRKEILDARKDTANETTIPTIEDIEADIACFEPDEDGEYYNSWGVTDNYDSDLPLSLILDKDFVLVKEQVY